MPNVFIHRPGTHNSATIIDPDTGLDMEVVEWSFNATVDGRVGIVSAYFPPGTSENGAAKTTRKATWSGDGKTLELSSKTTFTGQDGTERTGSSTDKLQLSGDGKVLTVNRHSEGGRGPQDSTLVFNK